ncbi:hypothetical protein CPB83DRAFT_410840 [Crepidotus variabilis]|uniref:F-box domain-containing protein n=1 Tax=Crepidotus variabilis TaxID=179855 RepID=A0A9P6ERI5_9AGAR|nr:hypothetical protein CPB83DRAFT_410840 [Crepidotus variabilis]
MICPELIADKRWTQTLIIIQRPIVSWRFDKLHYTICNAISRQLKVTSMSLPYDILSLIIEQLGNEDITNTLAAAAQTCKEVASLCQAQLFKKIIIWNPNTKRFGVAFDRSRRLIPILASSPRLAKLVSSLSLYIDDDIPHGAAYGNLSQALTNMMAVKSLFIDLFHHDWPTKYDFLTQHLLRRPSLVTLKLNRVENLEIADLLQCSNLQSLSLEVVRRIQSIDPPVDTFETGSASRIAVSDLRVHRIDISLLRNPSKRRSVFLDATSIRRISSFFDASNNRQSLRILFEQAHYIEELALSSMHH